MKERFLSYTESFLTDLVFFSIAGMSFGLIPMYFRLDDKLIVKILLISFTGIVILSCLVFPMSILIKKIKSSGCGATRLIEVVVRFIVCFVLSILTVLIVGARTNGFGIDKTDLNNSFYLCVTTQLVSVPLLSFKDGFMQYIIHQIECVIIGGPITFGLSVLFSRLISNALIGSIGDLALRSVLTGASWAIAFLIARFLINCTCQIKEGSKQKSVEDEELENE